MVGPKCFLLGPTKIFSPKSWEKTEDEFFLIDKNAYVQVPFFFLLP